MSGWRGWTKQTILAPSHLCCLLLALVGFLNFGITYYNIYFENMPNGASSYPSFHTLRIYDKDTISNVCFNKLPHMKLWQASSTRRLNAVCRIFICYHITVPMSKLRTAAPHSGCWLIRNLSGAQFALLWPNTVSYKQSAVPCIVPCHLAVLLSLITLSAQPLVLYKTFKTKIHFQQTRNKIKCPDVKDNVFNCWSMLILCDMWKVQCWDLQKSIAPC